jgi:hypothetical protein
MFLSSSWRLNANRLDVHQSRVNGVITRRFGMSACIINDTLSEGGGKDVFRNVGCLLHSVTSVGETSDLDTNFKLFLIQLQVCAA